MFYTERENNSAVYWFHFSWINGMMKAYLYIFNTLMWQQDTQKTTLLFSELFSKFMKNLWPFRETVWPDLMHLTLVLSTCKTHKSILDCLTLRMPAELMYIQSYTSRIQFTTLLLSLFVQRLILQVFPRQI